MNKYNNNTHYFVIFSDSCMPALVEFCDKKLKTQLKVFRHNEHIAIECNNMESARSTSKWIERKLLGTSKAIHSITPFSVSNIHQSEDWMLGGEWNAGIMRWVVESAIVQKNAQLELLLSMMP